MEDFGTLKVPDRMIWVRIPKTAGTSISDTFKVAGLLRENKISDRGVMVFKLKHIPQLISEHRDFWTSTPKFIFVRNPWDRFVSGWHYCRSTRHLVSVEDVVNNLPIRKRFGCFKRDHDWYHITCSQTFAAHQFCNNIDYVFRFENLENDLRTIVEGMGGKRFKMHHRRQGRHKPYWEYYNDDRDVELVRRIFEEDVVNFNYTFGDAC